MGKIITTLSPDDYKKLLTEKMFARKPQRRSIYYFDTVSKTLSEKNLTLQVEEFEKEEHMFLLKLKDRRGFGRKNLVEKNIQRTQFDLLRSMNTDFETDLQNILASNEATNVIMLGSIVIEEIVVPAFDTSQSVWILNKTLYPSGNTEQTLVLSSQKKETLARTELCEYLDSLNISYSMPKKSRRELFLQ